MTTSWRLLLAAAPATGWWNMALDEVLLAAAGQGAAPTLRIYAWDGPWLSLGHAQSFEEAELARFRSAGVHVVRRVTGGRAVLHGADLTYSVSAPEAAFPPGLAASYRILSEALAVALREVGVDVERAATGARTAPDGEFDCFAEAADDELCVGGRKLAGSAQRRSGGALLQHGSIRLSPDPAAAARLAGIGRTATRLAELGLDPRTARHGLIAALPKVLSERLGVAVAEAPLTAEESAAAHRRAAELRRDPLGRRAGPASRAL